MTASHEVPNLLHGEETRFYGDSACRGKAQRERLKDIAPKAKDFTNKRAHRNCPLTDADMETNRHKSSVRSRVERPFLTLKRPRGFAKVRYHGLAKNANRAFAMLAMLNVGKWGRPLTGRCVQHEQNELECPVFPFKTGRFFDENVIGVTFSSQFQITAEFCGGLFSISLDNLDIFLAILTKEVIQMAQTEKK